ncbi:MAG: radical SAM protein [Chthoniobacterales bacterium]
MALLKSFLEQQGVSADIVDLNLDAAEHLGAHISSQAVSDSCNARTLPALNGPYFKAEDHLSTIAEQFLGEWDLQSGFRFRTLDASSSDSVCHHSTLKSPFTDFFLRESVPRVLESQSGLIGISITIPTQLVPTFELCRLLRKAGFRGRIILGGNMVSRLGESLCLDWVFDLVDGFISFQGEEALLALSQEPDDWSSIPNLTWRKDGKIISNPTCTLKRQDFSMPDFDGLPLEGYWGFRYLPIVASRGCYYGKCTFCAIPFGWGNGGFIGHGSPEDVVECIRSAYERYGIPNFKFVDEALHPQLIRRIAELLLKMSLPIAFEGYARFDAVWGEQEFLSLLSRAGLRKVYLGLELAPSNSRSLLNKGDSVGRHAVSILQNLHQAGILTHSFCMFGFPGTGVDEALETVEFVRQHSSLIDSLDIFPFYYAKHTHVEGIRTIINPAKDWAVEHDYVPARQDVLPADRVATLCHEIEDVIWNERPEWLHPVYRMFSPWAISAKHPSQRNMHLPLELAPAWTREQTIESNKLLAGNLTKL